MNKSSKKLFAKNLTFINLLLSSIFIIIAIYL